MFWCARRALTLEMRWNPLQYFQNYREKRQYRFLGSHAFDACQLKKRLLPEQLLVSP
jgi:hypothetical protein